MGGQGIKNVMPVEGKYLSIDIELEKLDRFREWAHVQGWSRGVAD